MLHMLAKSLSYKVLAHWVIALSYRFLLTSLEKGRPSFSANTLAPTCKGSSRAVSMLSVLHLLAHPRQRNHILRMSSVRHLEDIMMSSGCPLKVLEWYSTSPVVRTHNILRTPSKQLFGTFSVCFENNTSWSWFSTIHCKLLWHYYLVYFQGFFLRASFVRISTATSNAEVP